MEQKNVKTPKLQETKEVYEAPVIETVEVKVERGFQTSPKPLRNAPDRGKPTW